jgi:hypothetical protein
VKSLIPFILLCFSLLACEKEAVKRRAKTAEEMAQQKSSSEYLRLLKGGVWHCQFHNAEELFGSSSGLLQIYNPQISFHFKNSRFIFSYDANGKPEEYFTADTWDSEISGHFKSETLDLKIIIERASGEGRILGFPKPVVFNSCNRLK